jgi:hypothetical protein
VAGTDGDELGGRSRARLRQRERGEISKHKTTLLAMRAVAHRELLATAGMNGEDETWLPDVTKLDGRRPRPSSAEHQSVNARMVRRGTGI